MDEQGMHERLNDSLPLAGDDCAVIDSLVLTTDMLHAKTDFPPGTTRYTAGWRSVGASLSDVAAMGGEAIAAVAAYGAPTLDWDELDAFVSGARDVCSAVGGQYVGGDLDVHDEFTVATAVVGRTEQPVYRSGASPGEIVCVTGTLGRTAAAMGLFANDEFEQANELFRFQPRIEAGQALAEVATAMIDSSDGLARSLHLLGDASDCGFEIKTPLPIDERLSAVVTQEERQDLGIFYGEDFELVCTVPAVAVDAIRENCPTDLTPIGRVIEDGITLDGDPLPNRGYTHGNQESGHF